MAQYFDDIQVSDKGMIKLTRKHGKDFVFPASNIIDIHHVDPKRDLIADALDWLGFDMEVQLATFMLQTKDDSLYVDRACLPDVMGRIKDARAYSNALATKKNGTFK